MAIPFAATFRYRVSVRSAEPVGSSVWIGEAVTLHPPDQPPGLVGRRAEFEVSNASVTLRATERARAWSAFQEVTWPLVTRASFEVGDILARLLQAGDEVFLNRDSMGALSLSVARRTELIAALGAMTGEPLPGLPTVQVDEDPRTQQCDDYYLGHLLRDQAAQVLWIDPQYEDVDRSLKRVDSLSPGRPLIVAYRGLEQRAFHDRLTRLRGFSPMAFVYEPRSASVDAWIAYLRQLPDKPPGDLELRFRVGGREVHLGQRQEASIAPFILRAEQVNWAVAWGRSAAAILRHPEDADRSAFRYASAAIASSRFEFARPSDS